MQIIADLLLRDLSQQIEEIIKVDQTDEQAVYTELTEYIATDRLIMEYRALLRAIADAPQDPHEGVGVWVSGFFGSGKSSFIKNMGYVLGNQPVLGQPASNLFKAQIEDETIHALLDSINSRTPTKVIMFDISKSSEVRRGDEKIAEVVYRALLSAMGYALDYDIAELEIELEEEGRLEEFIALCPQVNGVEWRIARKGAKKLNYASAILNQMQPDIFPQADSWSKSLRPQSNTITAETVVERTFQLAERRWPGYAVAFVIDEVGQYAARSDKKIEDLRALVELFGKVSKNRVKARQSIAPVWVIVTSQEKLDEVVAALDSRRVELARLQDRFKFRIDLAPSDIREVATRRVLAKRPEGEQHLRRLFQQSEGLLNAAVRLERTTRRSQITEEDFIQFYPYLPHYIEMSIDIMSGIRLQPGAPKHLGGSNRTIIKQAYEMLVSERTNLARQPIGALVTLDKTYELVEGNLSTEKQKDISDIVDRFRDDPADKGMAARVAKALALLEFVRDLPRTEANIAACLVDRVGQPAPLAAVEAALHRLDAAQFVRNTEEGWKLQTAQEKNWEAERRSYLNPKPRDRNEIVRATLGAIFEDPRLKTYRHQNLRNFRVGVTVNGTVVDEGQMPLNVIVAEDNESFAERLQEVRNDSRQSAHENEIFWLFSLNKQLDDLVAQLFASKEMARKYDQLRAQNKITNEELVCLQDEQSQIGRRQSHLRDRLTAAVENGQGLFRGHAKDAAALGKSLPDIFRSLFAYAVPDLYPKLAMGARPLKGSEAEEILKAANLNGLSQLFYSGEKGLNLVIKDGPNYVPNPNADIAKAVMDYLNREHGYGNKETRLGKALETHFGGIGYGWERDVLRLVLAVLFRAGTIEVSYQGRRYDSYQNPNSRAPFINNPAFRSALFTPVQPLGLKTLTSAVQNYEALSGQTVDVEKNAIAAAFKKMAEEELKLATPTLAAIQANHLPAADLVNDYVVSLNAIEEAGADECVQLLAGEGHSLKLARQQVRQIREATGYAGIETMQRARQAATQMWPVLASRSPDAALADEAAALREALASPTFYEAMPQIKRQAAAIVAAYEAAYRALHQERAARFGEAITAVKGRPEWAELPNELQNPVLTPLNQRACADLDLPPDKTVCQACHAHMGQMESDLTALPGLHSQVIADIQKRLQPEEKFERVRLMEFFNEPLASEEAIEKAVERLRQHLQKLVDQGVKILVE
jgi:hypothetical protein